MIDVDVQRVLVQELRRLGQTCKWYIVHPDHERMFVECESAAEAELAASQLEGMGFKVLRPELPGAVFFNVHLGMESLKKRGVYQVKAAIEFLSDEPDEVRDLLIAQLNAMGARPLVVDVKLLYDREKK